MSVYVVDTSTSRDVLINDALVNQGLALFVSDTQADKTGTETYDLEQPLLGVSEYVQVCACVCVCWRIYLQCSN